VSERPVVIVGSGFAGTILARLLVARGIEVTLVERGAHPRFAVGESSTPLAAICLERLAREYRLPDLAALAAHGRWQRELPGIGCGLKRGFTFYGHEAHEPFSNDDENNRRLLVTASPSDEIADVHWLRSDVDAFLVERAVAEGVAYVDRCELEAVDGRPGAWRLTGVRAGEAVSLDASFIVDGSGAGGFLAGQPAFEAGAAAPPGPRTGLVFSHFSGVAPFAEAAGRARFPAGPYPDERAAVHHLIEEGWVYSLRFDDGRVSAGVVLDHSHPGTLGLMALGPVDAWRTVLGRYPTLEDQFADAESLEPVRLHAVLQRMGKSAAGPGWALLPHTHCFVSPMFSTGIAWSLTAVERLAGLLVRGPTRTNDGIAIYGALLTTEAAWIAALVEPAYRLRRDFAAFAAWTQFYFAAASFWEATQRLCEPPSPGGWSDVGFLGATDPGLRGAVGIGARELVDRTTTADGANRLVARLIARRNIAGLADSARRNAYPIDLDVLVGNAGLLGLDRREVARALPRLRGL